MNDNVAEFYFHTNSAQAIKDVQAFGDAASAVYKKVITDGQKYNAMLQSQIRQLRGELYGGMPSATALDARKISRDKTTSYAEHVGTQAFWKKRNLTAFSHINSYLQGLEIDTKEAKSIKAKAQKFNNELAEIAKLDAQGLKRANKVHQALVQNGYIQPSQKAVDQAIIEKRKSEADINLMGKKNDILQKEILNEKRNRLQDLKIQREQARLAKLQNSPISMGGLYTAGLAAYAVTAPIRHQMSFERQAAIAIKNLEGNTAGMYGGMPNAIMNIITSGYKNPKTGAALLGVMPEDYARYIGEFIQAGYSIYEQKYNPTTNRMEFPKDNNGNDIHSINTKSVESLQEIAALIPRVMSTLEVSEKTATKFLTKGKEILSYDYKEWVKNNMDKYNSGQGAVLDSEFLKLATAKIGYLAANNPLKGEQLMDFLVRLGPAASTANMPLEIAAGLGTFLINSGVTPQESATIISRMTQKDLLDRKSQFFKDPKDYEKAQNIRAIKDDFQGVTGPAGTMLYALSRAKENYNKTADIEKLRADLITITGARAGSQRGKAVGVMLREIDALENLIIKSNDKDKSTRFSFQKYGTYNTGMMAVIQQSDKELETMMNTTDMYVKRAAAIGTLTSIQVGNAMGPFVNKMLDNFTGLMFGENFEDMLKRFQDKDSPDKSFGGMIGFLQSDAGKKIIDLTGKIALGLVSWQLLNVLKTLTAKYPQMLKSTAGLVTGVLGNNTTYRFIRDNNINSRYSHIMSEGYISDSLNGRSNKFRAQRVERLAKIAKEQDILQTRYERKQKAGMDTTKLMNRIEMNKQEIGREAQIRARYERRYGGAVPMFFGSNISRGIAAKFPEEAARMGMFMSRMGMFMPKMGMFMPKMGTIGSVGIAAGMVNSSELIDWIQTKAVLEKKEAGNGKAHGFGTAFSAINPMEMKNQVAYMMMMTGNPVFRNAGAMYLGYQFFGGLIGKDESNSFLAWDPLGKMPLGKLLDTVALGLLISGNPALMGIGATWLLAHGLSNHFAPKQSAGPSQKDPYLSLPGGPELVKIQAKNDIDNYVKEYNNLGFWDREFGSKGAELMEKIIIGGERLKESQQEQEKQNVINMIVNVDKNGNATAETKDKPSIVNLFPNRNGENFTPAKNITFA